MNQGKIHIYTGDGHGKTPAAWGEALYAASEGKEVVIVQFLKRTTIQNSEFLQRLEPEIKFFRFEKSDANYEDLSEEEKREESMNMRNGLNFAKKVLATGGCDLLILDEVLGLLDVGVITMDDIKALIEAKDEETTLIMTGIWLSDEVCMLADEVSKIENMNFKVYDEIQG
ncbi:MAG: cob(I)yrinic acid a c-diamide adenosyltransferase [Lachnospiraceae bacterium]|jgi:cob(I)alamin adenosyltransferase|nr:cob(I)yrinic acid a c-diamide adenosyltransferase [Lachnospiraceae bacterium]